MTIETYGTRVELTTYGVSYTVRESHFTLDITLQFFFFQAAVGIRDGHVTGVQTCALPIYLLSVARTRIQQGRWYAAFEEIGDRSAAESLRGAELSLEVDAQDEAEEDPDAWYPSQLKGLTVLHVDGHELGVVAGIDHYPVQDLLIVRTQIGRAHV